MKFTADVSSSNFEAANRNVSSENPIPTRLHNLRAAGDYPASLSGKPLRRRHAAEELRGVAVMADVLHGFFLIEGCRAVRPRNPAELLQSQRDLNGRGWEAASLQLKHPEVARGRTPAALSPPPTPENVRRLNLFTGS